MQSHFLQSSTWENYQKLEGHQTFRLNGPNFTALAILMPTPLGNYLFLPYGPATSSKTGLSQALKALKTLAQQKNAIFIRIEPTLPLKRSELAKIAAKHQFSLQKSQDLDPAHTWHLDLSLPTDSLLQAIEPRKVRYWRNFSKKGLQIRTTKDPKSITILSNLLQKLGEIDNFTPQDVQHLKNQLKSGFATLYLVELSENQPASSVKTTTKPIAAALVYDYQKTRYYAHAATDFSYRNLAAGTILLIQLIIDAKNSGQSIFDFWGITTSTDPKHPWYGFTQYKKSFGGYQVDYAGTYDLVLNRHRYRLYHLIRQLNRLKRRLFH